MLVVFLFFVNITPCFSQIDESKAKRKSSDKAVRKTNPKTKNPLLIENKLAAAFVPLNPGNSVLSVITGEGTLYLVEIANDGRLAVRSSAEKGAIIYPAEIFDRSLRFIGNPSVTRGVYGLEITAISTGHKLIKINNKEGWRTEFLGELAGQPDLKFKGNPTITIYRRNIPLEVIISVISMTQDDRLIEFKKSSFETKWVINYIAEIAGRGDEKFTKTISQTQNGEKSQDVVAITTEGKLLHLWNDETGNAWHGEFPAELAGIGSARFQDGATIIKHNKWGGQTIAAITKEYELIILNYHSGSNWTFHEPIKKLGQSTFKFYSLPAIGTIDESSFGIRLAIIGIATDKIIQLYQDDRKNWIFDCPNCLAAQPTMEMASSPAVLFLNANYARKMILCKTKDGRYPKIYDTSKWIIEYPFE